MCNVKNGKVESVSKLDLSLQSGALFNTVRRGAPRQQRGA